MADPQTVADKLNRVKTSQTLARDKQVYEGHSFVHGSSPTWLHFAFCDLFADPFVDVKQRQLEQDVIMGISKARKAAAQRLESKDASAKTTTNDKESSDGQGKEAVVQLAMSMKFVGNIFKRLLSEELGDCSRHVNCVQHALVEALQIGARLPIGKCEDVHTSFLAFLQYFVGRVSAMRPGEMLIFPGGWRRKTIPGHALVHVLERVTMQHYTFSTCNTKEGEGLKYHAARPQCAPPKLRRALTICCDDIPASRLSDSSFWYMLFVLWCTHPMPMVRHICTNN